MPTFKTKPVTVEAEVFTGEIPAILKDEKDELIPDEVGLAVEPKVDGYTKITIYHQGLVDFEVHPGDMVVRHEDGTFSVCNPDVFAKTFKPVDEPPSRMQTDVEVFCTGCGTSIGYVVEDGHKEWLCETCGGGKISSVMEGVA